MIWSMPIKTKVLYYLYSIYWGKPWGISFEKTGCGKNEKRSADLFEICEPSAILQQDKSVSSMS